MSLRLFQTHFADCYLYFLQDITLADDSTKYRDAGGAIQLVQAKKDLIQKSLDKLRETSTVRTSVLLHWMIKDMLPYIVSQL